MHTVKAVEVLNCTGNTNCAAFQAFLQHLDDIGVVLLAQQQPRLQPFPNGDDAQRLEKSAPLQFVQNIVLKLRDKRHSRFPVQRFKQRPPVSGRTKKNAFPRRQFHIRLSVCLRFFALFRCSVFIVQRKDRCLGINSVVAQMAFVLLRFAGEPGCFTGKFRFQRRAGIDRVRHGAYHLRISAEADRPKMLLASVRFKDDRVRIRAETDLLLGIVIADWHESAFLWHSWFHSFHRFWTQKDRNCQAAITVLLVLLYFGIHWPAHGTGAYLSPSFHLRPSSAPP